MPLRERHDILVIIIIIQEAAGNALISLSASIVDDF